MHTEEKTPAVAHFKDLDYGIFALASFAREESLYCVKGYVRDEDEELHDRLGSGPIKGIPKAGLA